MTRLQRSSGTTARLLARSLAAFPMILVMIAAITVALALLATTLPRAIDGVIGDIVRHDVAGASPLNRDIIAAGRGLYDLGAAVDGAPADMTEDGASVWGRLDDQLGAFRETLPEPLRGALGDADFTAATVPTASLQAGLLPAELGLRYDPRYLSRITVTDGRAPETVPTSLPTVEPLEVLASVSSAEKIDWSIGEQRPLRLNGGFQQLVLVGTFTAIDADATYWTQATATRRPAVLPGTPPVVQAMVFVDPAGFPAARAAELPVKSSVWFPTRANAISVDTQRDIATQARQLTTSEQPLGDSAQPWLVFGSRLPELLDDSLARSVSTQAVLTLILISPVGLAVVLEILVARLAAERLRPSLMLLAARGASRRQRLFVVGLPILLLGMMAAVGGCALGLLLPGGGLSSVGVLAVAITAVTPALLLSAFTVRVGTTPGADRASLGRLVRLAGEVLVVLATAAAVIATVQRGTADAEAPAAAVDLLASAVPLLLSLVGCIVALRIYPPLVRRWLDTAQAGRGIGRFLGLARAIRGGTAGLIPLLAVILGVSVAVFSGLLSATLSTGLDTAARASVGADISLTNVRLDQSALQDLRGIEGVSAVAGVAIDRSQRFEFAGHEQLNASVLLVDSTELAAVQDGVPGRVPLDDRLLGGGSDGAPVMVSTKLSTALAGVQAAELDRQPVRVVGAALSGRQLGLSGNWVLIDRAHADSIDFISPAVSVKVLVRVTPGADIEAVTDRIQAALPVSATSPTATAPALTTVADTVAVLSTNPAVGEVHLAAGLAILGAALITSLALALTLLLDGPARRGAVTLLASVGLSRRQGAGIVRWEIIPLGVAGLVGGALLGAALSMVVLVIVDLRPFTGGVDQPAIAASPWMTGGTIALFAAVFLVTGAVAARHATLRPRRPAAASLPPHHSGRTS